MKKSFEKLMSYMEEGKEEAKTAREEIRIFLERREVFLLKIRMTEIYFLM